MCVWGQPPGWLEGAVVGVMADLQGASPIVGLVAAALLVDGMDGVSLAVIEPGRLTGPLPQLPEPDELAPDPVGMPGEGTSCRAGFRVLGSWRGSPRSSKRIWLKPMPRGVRPVRRARTIRIPRARWCVTAKPGGSANAYASRCTGLAEARSRHGGAPPRPGRPRPAGRASASTSSDLPPLTGARSNPASQIPTTTALTSTGGRPTWHLAAGCGCLTYPVRMVAQN